LDQLTSTQLSEWEAYDKTDPIGTWRDDFRMASLSALIVNIVQGLYHEEGVEPEIVSPSQYMPIWDSAIARKIREKPKQTAEALKNALMSIFKAHNARIDRIEKLKKRPPTLLKNKKP
jgi:hypothetical protein